LKIKSKILRRILIDISENKIKNKLMVV